jgi:hypothetical protein
MSYFQIEKQPDDEEIKDDVMLVTASYHLEEGDSGYNKYIAEYPHKTPFRHHEQFFKADVSEEEIQKYFDSVMAEMIDAYLDTDIHRLKNDAGTQEAI